MTQHITVVDWSPEWTVMFEKEAELIQRILGENCVAIYHIGSTSVPGLSAKPIIDMMPVVKNIEGVDHTRSEFEKAGYEYMGEFGIPGRRYLRKGGDERTHQIHIFEQSNSQYIERHLAVRDYLRTHKDACDEYARLKKALAEKYPYDIDGYCDGKDAFVKKLEETALLWKKSFCNRKCTPEEDLQKIVWKEGKKMEQEIICSSEADSDYIHEKLREHNARYMRDTGDYNFHNRER